MLKSCYFEDRYIDLGSVDSEECNQFSIVVGRNGTGKSRLLSSLVQHFAPPPASDLPSRYHADSRYLSSVKHDRVPSGVIAVSTSPFDKFPLGGSDASIDRYSYLGLRGLPSANLGLAFMSRIIGRLVGAILRDVNRARVIGSTLDDLGYLPHLKARLLLQIGKQEIQEFRAADDPVAFLLANRRFGRPNRFGPQSTGYWPGVPRRLNDLDVIARAEELALALNQFLEFDTPSRQEILLDDNGITEVRYGIPVGSEHVTLMEAGLLRLKDVELQKVGAREPFRISDASSGEQCVVMTLIGIASHIADNALVCIDEPEVCLHPEWQERYMAKLMSTFSEFKGCHFVIATHSPQIIANLRDRNCFVTDMERGTTTTAAELSRRSADFQLANVFNAPGYKNEYLSRELIAALATLSSEMDPPASVMEKARQLVSFKPALHESDPLNGLIDMLADALSEVGR